ncbi:MAG: ribosomal protein S18-alanine N-acetyltransferase [Pseudomonadota bacterium]
MATVKNPDFGKNPAIFIREAGPEKIDAVMEIMARAFPSEFGESWNEGQCRSMLSLMNTHLMLAGTTVGEQSFFCGFCIYRMVAGELELLMIAVDPEQQQFGIGQMMIRQLISNARANEVEAIFLEVRSSNPAQNLYRKLGFERIGHRKAYYTGSDGQKHDAITYRRKI